MEPAPVNIALKTQELNFLQKLLQMYWVNPASWLLDEFSLRDGNLVIVRKNGDRFEAPLDSVEATFAVDNYDRREISVQAGEKTTRFKEIPGMLSEEEWNAIIAALKPSKSALGELTDVMREAQESFED